MMNPSIFRFHLYFYKMLKNEILPKGYEALKNDLRLNAKQKLLENGKSGKVDALIARSQSLRDNHEEILDSDWHIEISEFAKNTSNPVRKLIEQMKIEPNPQLPMIALSIGDPTVFSDIGKPDTVTNAIMHCINLKKNDG